MRRATCWPLAALLLLLPLQLLAQEGARAAYFDKINQFLAAGLDPKSDDAEWHRRGIYDACTSFSQARSAAHPDHFALKDGGGLDMSKLEAWRASKMTRLPKKVAIVFFGLTRSLSTTACNLWRQLFTPLEMHGIAYDTYLHTYEDSGHDVWETDAREWHLLPGLKEFHTTSQAQFLKKMEKDVDTRFSPPGAPKEDRSGPFGHRYNTLNLLCQYNSLQEATKLWYGKHPSDYDIVMYVRPDTAFVDPFDVTELSAVLEAADYHKNEVFVSANWGAGGAMNDRFAFGTPHAMQVFGTRMKIAEEWAQGTLTGKPAFLHGERFLWFHMVKYPGKSGRGWVYLYTDLLFMRVRGKGRNHCGVQPDSGDALGCQVEHKDCELMPFLEELDPDDLFFPRTHPAIGQRDPGLAHSMAFLSSTKEIAGSRFDVLPPPRDWTMDERVAGIPMCDFTKVDRRSKPKHRALRLRGIPGLAKTEGPEDFADMGGKLKLVGASPVVRVTGKTAPPPSGGKLISAARTKELQDEVLLHPQRWELTLSTASRIQEWLRRREMMLRADWDAAAKKSGSVRFDFSDRTSIEAMSAFDDYLRQHASANSPNTPTKLEWMKRLGWAMDLCMYYQMGEGGLHRHCEGSYEREATTDVVQRPTVRNVRHQTKVLPSLDMACCPRKYPFAYNDGHIMRDVMVALQNSAGEAVEPRQDTDSMQYIQLLEDE